MSGLAVDELEDAGFGLQVPHARENTVENISLAVRMSSRVAVIIAKIAGKSTVIKLLGGELQPGFGTI